MSILVLSILLGSDYIYYSLLDKEVFNKEIIQLCDFVVDTSASNVYQNAKDIYLLYKDYMK
jgi:hypothetical protein